MYCRENLSNPSIAIDGFVSTAISEQLKLQADVLAHGSCLHKGTELEFCSTHVAAFIRSMGCNANSYRCRPLIA